MFVNREKDKITSIIGLGSSFRGDITVRGTLRVDGEIEGSVNADVLIVGEKGSIKGDINVKKADIDGKIEGNIVAEDMVEIGTKGYVNGDIKTHKLSIAEGCFFNGRVTMDKKASKIVEFQTEQGNKIN